MLRDVQGYIGKYLAPYTGIFRGWDHKEHAHFNNTKVSQITLAS